MSLSLHLLNVDTVDATSPWLALSRSLCPFAPVTRSTTFEPMVSTSVARQESLTNSYTCLMLSLSAHQFTEAHFLQLIYFKLPGELALFLLPLNVPDLHWK